MGLDQIAYKLKKNFINKNVDFSLNDEECCDSEMDEFAFGENIGTSTNSWKNCILIKEAKKRYIILAG